MTGLFKSRAALLAIIGAGLIAATQARAPGFAAPSNLALLFNDTSPLIILAMGQMLVILTKCVDLSVAATLALCGMAAALLDGMGAPPIVAILAATSLGALLGMLNGLLVWRAGIPSIVATLGTMTIYRGAIFLMTDGKWINAHEMSAPFKALPRAVIFGLPVLGWIALGVVAATGLLLNRTALGRAFYAVGGAPQAAVYAGLDVGRTQFWAFTLSGLLAGLTGYLWVSRYAVAYVDIALGFELDVVAACVVGGVAISGGAGSVAGVLMGALFLGLIKNILPVAQISPFWQMAISGAAILSAAALGVRRSRGTGRLILENRS